MSSQHANHPFSARVPGDDLARFRARVSANGETITGALVGLMDFYSRGDGMVAGTSVAFAIHEAICGCDAMGGAACVAPFDHWTIAARAAHHAVIPAATRTPASV